MILGKASGIDLLSRTIQVAGRPPIGFDVASIDIGITSEMPQMPGFSRYAVPAKPLGPFASRWRAFLSENSGGDIAVIGGGVAGAEIAMALSFASRNAGHSGMVSLVDRGRILEGLPERTTAKLRQALEAHAIDVFENRPVAGVEASGVRLDDGTLIPAVFVTGAAGARPQDWLAKTGLALTDGFIDVDETLRSSDTSIFAVGDCAHMLQSPRPKAGVFAVRQAPVLYDNLRTALADKGKYRAYKPQIDFLKLISLGGKSALADRFGIALSGPKLWNWKDRIDQAFMEKFRTLPKMEPEALPKLHAAGILEAKSDTPMCGGCGSKVGRGALSAALTRLPAPTRRDVSMISGDDAGLLSFGGVRQVISTDHLRAFSQEPVMMTRIAATHALGDIWAMGAAPQAATATVILPRMTASLAERTVSEIMTAAHEVMSDSGAEIVGGHTSQGSEMTIGFTVTGLCEAPPISVSGAKAGDIIILTKPIGSGVLMAAEMQGAAAGAWIAAAFDWMVQSQAEASRILSGAHAMTDVTGFGLAGHLLNICEASNFGATIALSEVPVMEGAVEMATAGIRSTIFEENRAAMPGAPHTPLHDLLFDPQTAGGLLACVRESEAKDALAALQAAGYTAAIIGQMTDAEATLSFE